MFSRRHPYLFFLLVLAGIIAGCMVVVSVISFFAEDKGEMKFGEKVGVIEVTGAILDPAPVLDSLKRFRQAEAVKAIVVRIDSPGGAVGPSQEIYGEIRKTIEKKPVIASMGTVAASGGYYIASATEGIMANPGTITGSIGVIMEYTNLRELFEKIGLYPVIIKSGKYKDTGSPLRKMTEDEEKLLQNFVDNVHRQFVEDVAAGRQMDKQKVAEIADGRILSGQTALEHGLVDRMGNLADAVDWAAEKGGIKGRVKTIYLPEEEPSLVKYLLETTGAQVRQWLARTETGVLSGGYMYDPAAAR
ncbi:MAG: signal peptide peptidase SppA [Desulfobacteraceae bacterium]|nr:signal peptide peptidase SppA [Desulfobacteraceae bacterium]MCF8095734.1 signal peptide peptidase SppA [Desulfobacteraceae bacterium]